MSVLILTHREIERLLPMAECIRVMTDALVTLARGGVHQPLRMIVQPPTASGLMALMPAYIAEGTPCYGLKIICVFPGNPAKGMDAHQGAQTNPTTLCFPEVRFLLILRRAEAAYLLLAH